MLRAQMELPNGCSTVLWEDGERVFCRGWRLDDDGKRRAVLVVLPAAEHPSPSCLDCLAHEYGLKAELDGAWAVQPLDLVSRGGHTMLILEDSGGEPLGRLLGTPMEVGSFLRLAAGIASAVGKLHQRGLVHKDIKPANILVNGPTGAVKFTGFGVASRLPRERQSPEPPETIAGTLAYMAPEQTGRMNRSVDSRSDLYALGVTFYELLTGALPFTATDPNELIHCHIAREPVPPGELASAVPAPLSMIVMKLLAKTAEERYQTAAGVRGGSPQVPHRLGVDRPDRPVPAWTAGRVGAVDDPGEALRTRGRDRHPARRLRPRRDAWPLGARSGLWLFGHRQVVGSQ